MGTTDAEKLLDDGFSQMDEGDYKKAIKTFDRAIKAAPENPVGYFGKAEASLGDNRLSLMDVSKLYRKVLELDGENDLFLTSYADFCLSNGLLEKGVEMYEKVAELIPENASTIYIDLAYYYTNYGLLFLTRQFGKEKEDIYRDAWGYLEKGYGLTNESGMEQLIALAEWETKMEGEGMRFPWEEELEGNEKGRMEGMTDLRELLDRYGTSSDPLTLLELGQQCFYSGQVICGEQCYLRAIEADEEMGREVYNDLSSLLYSTSRDLLSDEIIGEDIARGLATKALYYSIRAMGMNPEGMRDLLADR